MPEIPPEVLADLAEAASEFSEDEDWHMLVPDLSRPGGYVAVFADGSWGRWIPSAQAFHSGAA